MAEAEDILRQVFASEVDYSYAKQREALLLSIPARTQEQNDELALRQRQIAHDDAVIAQWIARVGVLRGRTPAQVRGALDNVANRTLRDSVLEEWRKRADDDVTAKREMKAAIEALPATEEYAALAAQLLSLMSGQLVDRQALLANLQNKDAFTARLEAKAQTREAYRDRIVAIKAAVKSTWSP